MKNKNTLTTTSKRSLKSIRLFQSVRAPIQCALVAGLLAMMGAQSAHAVDAKFVGGDQEIGLHERASFPVQTSTSQTSEFTAWCEVSSLGGSATVMFDGEGYVPLSDPNVGDMIMLNGGETRRFELAGTFEAGGEGEVAFYFANIPAGFCFPGQQCAKVEDGGEKVRVKCGAH